MPVLKVVPIFFAFSAYFCLFSCKNRNYNSSSAQNSWGTVSGQFPDDVSGRHACPSLPGLLDSGAEFTTVYHWTNDARALSNPKEYLVSTIRTAIIENDKGNMGGAMGNGLYIAMDPFQSKNYGTNLLMMKIKPHSRFADSNPNMPYVDNYKAGCAGVRYDYAPGIDDTYLGNTGSPALIMWDSASVDAQSVTVINPTLADKIPLPLEANTLKELFSANQDNDASWELGMKGFIPYLNTTQQLHVGGFAFAKGAEFQQRYEKCKDKFQSSTPPNLDFVWVRHIFPWRFDAPRLGQLLAEYVPVWKICAPYLGMGTGQEASVADILHAVEAYVSKDLVATQADFEKNHADKLAHWRFIVPYWQKQYSLKNWQPAAH